MIFFAFDDENIPNLSGLELVMQQPQKHPGNPILARGGDGEPDALRAQCSAVVRDNDRLRMWYSAHGGAGPRVAYAESDDGLIWRKPDLGLVDYQGSRHNNLVDAQPGLNTVTVLFDPDAPADRRYVMAGEDMRWWSAGGWRLAGPSSLRIDTSPDGLRWTPVRDQPGLITPQHEAMTLYRFNNRYHLGGHQISPLLRLPMQQHDLGGYLGPRTFVVWRSPVLDRWPIEATRAFFKPMRSSSPERSDWDREEVHLGAAVTVYPNVCLGIYGQWHHPIDCQVTKTDAEAVRTVEGGYATDGQLDYFGPAVSVDLGLIISNDGLHFREPAPGFTFIGRDQELTWDRDFADNREADKILLLQGSMLNTADRTLIYYSASAPNGNTAGMGKGGTNIGVATLPRDRFGGLRVLPGKTRGTLVTRPVSVNQGAALCLNADVPPGASLKVSLLDADGLESLPGYDYDAQQTCVGSGFDIPIRWQSRPYLPPDSMFRIRVELTGAASVYALYL